MKVSSHTPGIRLEISGAYECPHIGRGCLLGSAFGCLTPLLVVIGLGVLQFHQASSLYYWVWGGLTLAALFLAMLISMPRDEFSRLRLDRGGDELRWWRWTRGRQEVEYRLALSDVKALQVEASGVEQFRHQISVVFFVERLPDEIAQRFSASESGGRAAFEKFERRFLHQGASVEELQWSEEGQAISELHSFELDFELDWAGDREIHEFAQSFAEYFQLPPMETWRDEDDTLFTCGFPKVSAIEPEEHTADQNREVAWSSILEGIPEVNWKKISGASGNDTGVLFRHRVSPFAGVFLGLVLAVISSVWLLNVMSLWVLIELGDEVFISLVFAVSVGGYFSKRDRAIRRVRVDGLRRTISIEGTVPTKELLFTDVERVVRVEGEEPAVVIDAKLGSLHLPISEDHLTEPQAAMVATDLAQRIGVPAISFAPPKGNDDTAETDRFEDDDDDDDDDF